MNVVLWLVFLTVGLEFRKPPKMISRLTTVVSFFFLIPMVVVKQWILVETGGGLADRFISIPLSVFTPWFMFSILLAYLGVANFLELLDRDIVFRKVPKQEPPPAQEASY